MKTITLEEIRKRRNLPSAPSPLDVQTPSALPSPMKTITLAEIRNRGQEEDEYPFDDDTKLKKKDLKSGRNAREIRDYMSQRFGVDYRKDQGKSDEDVVEDFVDHMRYFNSNIVTTAGEVRYIRDADDTKKATAARAYELYDKLGSVFTNDGFMGAVDGMKDYFMATIKDPSTYAGLLTGGIAKASGVGLTQAGRMATKRAAVEAGKKALASGATQQAAKEAGEEAAKMAAKRFAAEGVKNPVSAKIRRQAARREREIFLLEAKKRARKEVLKKQSVKDNKKVLMGTTALDSTFAVMHDVTLQNTLLKAGAQQDYNLVQTGFSSVLGGIGGATQLLFGRATGKSGLSDSDILVESARARTESREGIDEAARQLSARQSAKQIKLSEEAAKDAAAIIMEKARAWDVKVEAGKDSFDDVPTSVDFIKDMMLGPDGDGKGGLVKLFKDQGLKLPKGFTVSDVMTSVVQSMSQEELKKINRSLEPKGFTLGQTTELATSLGDLLAIEIRKGGQVLNVMSQVRKTLDAANLHGHQLIEGQAGTIKALDDEAKKAKKAKVGQYGQNLWRRMLVSSPSTTAVNVLGFGQFYVGQSLADLFSATGSTMYGLAKGGTRTEAGRESLRVAKVYMQIQSQKIRNLLDPYTTHDTYMQFLNENKDLRSILFESYTGGVERSGKRYGIDPDSAWFKRAEALADGSNRLTGVKLQDTFTKSQMYITEMDKWLRLNKGVTLEETLKKGDLSVIDDDVIGGALDTTMKSVFAKDYTTEDQLLNAAAKQVENFSNIPVIGTILPFGRFFNNTLATAYQWSVGGMVEGASAIMKKEKRNIKTVEAFSRSLVGFSSLKLAMEYDERKREKGYAWHHMDTGGGKVIDAKNMFPVSLWLAVGRAGNLSKNGETVPRDLIEDVTAQLAVGQFARDLQFGNDLYNMFDVLYNQEEGARQASFNALYKQGGNILAGFTRPLDALNKMVGFINDSDTAKDVRQEKGFSTFTVGASKYVDNLLEIFSDKIDGITGEELRVATREGKIKDANPILRIMGITQVPTRTGVEKAYSMAEAHPWKANERSQIPAYDKILNEVVVPLFEERVLDVIGSDSWKNASVNTRRVQLNSIKNDVKSQVRKHLLTTDLPEGSINALRRKAAVTGSREERAEARKFLKERFGWDGNIGELGNDPESLEILQTYFSFISVYRKENKR